MNVQKIMILGVSVGLGACSLTTVDIPVQVTPPAQFEYAHQAQGDPELSQWWLSWQDPVLTQLVEQGMQNNKDIAMATSRLLEAQANSGLVAADIGPQVGMVGKLLAQQVRVDNPIASAHPLLPPVAAANHFSDSVRGGLLGFTAAWEPDIFGAKQSDADAAHAATLVEAEKVHGSQVIVASTVAAHYLQYRYIDKKIALLQQKESTLAMIQHYLQGRFQAGQVDSSDRLDAQMQLAALKAQTVTWYAERDSHARSIAVLIGKVPQGFKIANSQVDILAHIPAAPSGQIPSEVIARRPDVRANIEAITARAAQVASAKADFFPRFDIQFLGGTGKIRIGNIPSIVSGLTGIVSAGVSLPIFTNGRLQRTIDASDARLKTAVLAYDKSVLNALAEVDNVYQAQFMLDRQVDLLAKAFVLSKKRASALYKSFEYGQKTLDEALIAKMVVHDMAEKVNAASLAKGLNTLNLYKALGGGWK